MNDSSAAYEKLAVRALSDASTELPVHITKLQQTIINPYCKKTGQEVLTWKNTDWRSLSEFVYHLASKQYISIQGTKIIKLLLPSSSLSAFQDEVNSQPPLQRQPTHSVAGKVNSLEELSSQSKRRRTMDSYAFDKELSDIANTSSLEEASQQPSVSSFHQAVLHRGVSAPPNQIVYIDVDGHLGDGVDDSEEHGCTNQESINTKSDFSVWLKQQASQQTHSMPTSPPNDTFSVKSQHNIAPNSNETNAIKNTPNKPNTTNKTPPPPTITTTTISSTTLKPSPLSEKSSQTTCPACPVCGVPLPGMNETQIGHHVDECLTNDFLEGETGGTLDDHPGGDKYDHNSTDNFHSSALTFVCPYPGCHIPTSLTAIEFGKHVADVHRNDEMQSLFCPICRFIGEDDEFMAPHNSRNLHLWRHLNSIHQDIMPNAPSGDLFSAFHTKPSPHVPLPSLPPVTPFPPPSLPHPQPTSTTTTTTTTLQAHSPTNKTKITTISSPYSPSSPSYSPSSPSYSPSSPSYTHVSPSPNSNNNNASTSTIYKINKFIDSLGSTDKQRDMTTKSNAKPNTNTNVNANTNTNPNSFFKLDPQHQSSIFGEIPLQSASTSQTSTISAFSIPLPSKTTSIQNDYTVASGHDGDSNFRNPYPSNITTSGYNFGTFGTTNSSTTTNSTATVIGDSSLYIDYVLHDDWKDRECTICFEEFLRNQQLARMQCMCVFHKHCLDQWFLKRRHCPLHTCD